MTLSAHVGVGFLLERDGKILLGKRSPSKDFGANLWEIPSGRVEDGESLEEAIQREAKEELNVNILASNLLNSYIFKRNEHNLILNVYLCQFSGEPQKSDEHSEIRWVDPLEAENYFNFPTQMQSIKQYLLLRDCIR